MGLRGFGHRPQKQVSRAARSHSTDSVLARAALVASSGETWAFATRAELLVVSATDAAGGQGDDDARGAPDVVVHRQWCDVDRATFDTEANVIRVHWVDAAEPTLLTLGPHRTALPQVLRERVQWSVVLSETVRFPGGRTARVAVRRRADGELFSQVIGDGYIDMTDPDTAHRVDDAEARVRSAAGLPG